MTKSRSFDPENWDSFRAQAHAALDSAVDQMENRQTAPVWQPVPESVRANLKFSLPRKSSLPEDIVAQIEQDFLPHSVGNTHARFFGWVHGAGTPSGIIPELFAGAMNANLGGRDHVANEVEKQVIDWCRQMFDFPEDAGGLIVSGTSMATLIALKTARDEAGEGDLVGYTSAQAHSCIRATFDILGIGAENLRAIPTDGDFRMDTNALLAAIAEDRQQGKSPFAIVGTAGSVNVGAIDPLDQLADIARTEDLWFHVDGAFGALGVLHHDLKPLLKGIERADSLAFDFHKWMHVNYDAGFILIRDGEKQRRAFSDRAEYLEGATRGLAAGNPWFCEYGPELSRGFRALKVWYQMRERGLDRIGEKIAENCEQAAYLSKLVVADPQLELLAPVALNITCFRFTPANRSEHKLDNLNSEIVTELQMRGLAAPSTTRIGGKLAIRVNITNHRTQTSDLDFLVHEVLKLGKELT